MLKWFLIHQYFTLELTLSSRINLEVEREPPRFWSPCISHCHFSVKKGGLALSAYFENRFLLNQQLWLLRCPSPPQIRPHKTFGVRRAVWCHHLCLTNRHQFLCQTLYGTVFGLLLTESKNIWLSSCLQSLEFSLKSFPDFDLLFLLLKRNVYFSWLALGEENKAGMREDLCPKEKH